MLTSYYKWSKFWLYQQLATQIDAMLDSNTSDVDPSMFPYGLEKNDGVVLECYHWFFRVALDAIGIGEYFVIDTG